MSKFIFTAKVRRTVVDTLTISVDANNIDDAADKATGALLAFSGPASEEEVNYCYVEDRETLNAEVLDLYGESC